MLRIMQRKWSEEMKNIDKELIDWAVKKITEEYPEDVVLLIGQLGGCKIPTDEQTMAFDFFVPANERGNQLAQTFVIEDMGYDLYPISWERLEGIANLQEPRMIFAFDQGQVIYAKSNREEDRFNALKEQLHKNLNNNNITFEKGLQDLNTAMEIFNTMLFEESLCKVRKAAGGISCYLMNAIAMINGTYLKHGYGNLLLEMERMEELPKGMEETYTNVIVASSIREIQKHCYELIKMTRDFFLVNKPLMQMRKEEGGINYTDLANWYHEARYTFRRIEYYSGKDEWEECFLLGCYLQIEFDAISEEFELKEMDVLSAFHKEDLKQFANRAKELETYIVEVLKENNAELKMYSSIEEFKES